MDRNLYEFLNSLFDLQEMPADRTEVKKTETPSGSIFPDNGGRAEGKRYLKPKFETNFPLVHPVHTDVSEKDGVVLIEMDIPGFTKDEITVSVTNGILSVVAKKDEKEEDKDRQVIIAERHSEYRRKFRVPQNRVPSDFSVSYENGVLSVSYEKEKEEDKKNTRIEIK